MKQTGRLFFGCILCAALVTLGFLLNVDRDEVIAAAEESHVPPVKEVFSSKPDVAFVGDDFSLPAVDNDKPVYDKYTTRQRQEKGLPTTYGGVRDYYYGDNVVYLTKDTHTDYIDRDIVYSILDKHPKRARAWWFVNVETMDEPHTFAYSVETFGTDYVFRVHLYLGYKINQRVNAYLRQVVQDLAATGELPPQTHDYSVYKDPGNIGTFKFVLIRKLLAPESDVEPSERTAITLKYIIRRAAGTPARWYGLENSNVSFEYVPLFTKFKAVNKMQRLAPNERP